MKNTNVLKLLFAFIMSIAMLGFALSMNKVPAPAAIAVLALIVILSFGRNRKFNFHLNADSLDITELTDALGEYFRKDKDQIFSNLLLGMNIDDRFDVLDDVKDELILPQLNMEDIVKPADPDNFTPTNDAIKIGARIGKVRGWKIDLLIVPQRLEKSWLGKFRKKGSDVFDMPLEQYIMNHIIQKAQDNIRRKALFLGVYNGAGNAPVDIFDGVLTMADAAILAGDITPVSTAAIDEDSAFEQLLVVYDELDEAYKNDISYAYVNSTVFDWIFRKFNPVLNANLISTDVQAMMKGGRINSMPAMPVPGTNCILFREPGMGSDTRIIVTAKDNLTYMTDSLNDANNIVTERFNRTIKIMIDAKSGVEFKQLDDNCFRISDGA
jgi:hypothetical protein